MEILDIVPENPQTLSNALNTQNPGRNPSPIFNKGLFNYQKANSVYQEFVLLQNKCLGSASTIKGMALRQHGTSNYLTLNQYIVSFVESKDGP